MPLPCPDYAPRVTSTLDSSPSPAQNPDPAGAGNTRHPGKAPRWIRGVYIANLVAQSGIILTGAIVRITGSGLGCPTWPECVEGSYVPTNRQAESWHKYVEFGNRLLTFVLAAAAIAAIVAALVDRHRRRTTGLERRTALTVLACVPLAGTIVQAVLGGITVLTGLNPATVAAHFLVSMALVAVCVLLVVRSGEVGDTPVVSTVHSAVRLLDLGSGGRDGHRGLSRCRHHRKWAALGDGRGGAVLLRSAHRCLAARRQCLFLGLTVGLLVAAASVSRAPSVLVRRTWLVLGIALVQGVIGYTQYFTGLPELLVALHVLGAIAVWIAVWFLPPTLRTRGSADARDADLVSRDHRISE